MCRPMATTFSNLPSDDGAAVFVNGVEAVLRANGNGVAQGSALTLSEGLNEIKIVHFEGGGGSRLQVSWKEASAATFTVLGPDDLSTTNTAGSDGSFTYDTKWPVGASRGWRNCRGDGDLYGV